MKILRRLIALAVYAALLIPTNNFRITAWMRAVEVTSVSFDRTMRRRRSQLENDRFSHHLRILQMAGPDREEQTLRIRA